jgi:hypothetical protein
MRTPPERDVLTNVAAIVPKLVRVLELLRIAVLAPGRSMMMVPAGISTPPTLVVVRARRK